MANQPKFRFDRAGITQLLSRDTYERDDVYLRELIANAIDSSATEVDLTLLLTAKGEEEVYGVVCKDNGSGMTRRLLDEQFLNLARRYEQEEGPRYGRFGIGVFTYLRVSRRLEVLTGVSNGKRWHLVVEPPEQLNDMNDVEVNCSDMPRSAFMGTCVALLFRSVLPLSSVLASLNYYIRANLPAKLTVRSLLRSRELVLDLVELCSGAPPGNNARTRWGDTKPATAAPVPSSELIEEGYVSVDTGGTDRVVLCESGIFVEQVGEELLPNPLKNLKVNALVSIRRGKLDLVSSRTTARRSDVFTAVRRCLDAPITRACINFLATRTWQLNDANDRLLQIFAEVTRRLTPNDLLSLLRTLDGRLQMSTYSATGTRLLTLREIGSEVSSGRFRSLACVTGETWGWEKKVGQIEGYDYEVFIHQRGCVQIALAQGALVFHCPKLDKDTPVVPFSGLQSYFWQYHRIPAVRDVIDFRSPDASAFPEYWGRSLSLPPGMQLAALSGSQRVVLDSSLNAILNSEDDVVRWLDGLCSAGYRVDSRTKSLIEAYLFLLGGKIDGAYRILRRELLRASQGGTPRNPADFRLGLTAMRPLREIEEQIDGWIGQSTKAFDNEFRDKDNGRVWVLKYFLPEYLASFLDDRRLVISNMPGFTWGDGVYVTPLRNACSTAAYGRAAVMGFIQPEHSRRVFDAVSPLGILLYQQWIQYYRYSFQQVTTTIHADYFNRVLRNKFRRHFRIDVVVFPPDQYNRNYVRPFQDRWLVVSDWLGAPPGAGSFGRSDRVAECRWVAIIGEAFSKVSEFRFRDLFGPELAGAATNVVPFPPSANDFAQIHQANSGVARNPQNMLLIRP